MGLFDGFLNILKKGASLMKDAAGPGESDDGTHFGSGMDPNNPLIWHLGGKNSPGPVKDMMYRYGRDDNMLSQPLSNDPVPVGAPPYKRPSTEGDPRFIRVPEQKGYSVDPKYRTVQVGGRPQGRQVDRIINAVQQGLGSTVPSPIMLSRTPAKESAPAPVQQTAPVQPPPTSGRKVPAKKTRRGPGKTPVAIPVATPSTEPVTVQPGAPGEDTRILGDSALSRTVGSTVQQVAPVAPPQTQEGGYASPDQTMGATPSYADVRSGAYAAPSPADIETQQSIAEQQRVQAAQQAETDRVAQNQASETMVGGLLRDGLPTMPQPKPEAVKPDAVQATAGTQTGQTQSQNQPIAAVAPAALDRDAIKAKAVEDAKKDLQAAMANGDQVKVREAKQRLAQAQMDYINTRPAEKKRGWRGFLESALLGAAKGAEDGPLGMLFGGISGGLGEAFNPDANQILRDEMFRKPKAQKELDRATKDLQDQQGITLKNQEIIDNELNSRRKLDEMYKPQYKGMRWVNGRLMADYVDPRTGRVSQEPMTQQTSEGEQFVDDPTKSYTKVVVDGVPTVVPSSEVAGLLIRLKALNKTAQTKALDPTKVEDAEDLLTTAQQNFEGMDLEIATAQTEYNNTFGEIGRIEQSIQELLAASGVTNPNDPTQMALVDQKPLTALRKELEKANGTLRLQEAKVAQMQKKKADAAANIERQKQRLQNLKARAQAAQPQQNTSVTVAPNTVPVSRVDDIIKNAPKP